MIIFQEPNRKDGFVCPICKTDKVAPITLVGVLGTENEKNIEAIQVHIGCIELYLVPTDDGSNKKVIMHAGEL